MDMIRLDGQFKDFPPFDSAFLPDDLFAISRDIAFKDRFSPLGAPDQVVGNKMYTMLVSMIFHGDVIHL